MDAGAAIKAYLEELRGFMAARRPPGFRYSCIHDYVLENGRNFESASLTAEQSELVGSIVARMSEAAIPKQCFYNAQILAMAFWSERVSYVEGFAICSIPIPIHHGWVSVDGKVIDVTWKEDGLPIIGEFPEGRGYYGASVSNEFISDRCAELGVAGTVLDDFERGFPLLKGARNG